MGYISAFNGVIELKMNGNSTKGFNINFIWPFERSGNNM
jgi:hypothetical protein